jgi:uncharacterized C2H2 Zn-finger protein
MAEHWWPCPRCGQQQRSQKPQGEAQEVTHCPQCAEDLQAEEEVKQFARGESLAGKKHR